MGEPAILPFDWADPFDLNHQLSDEERLVRDTAEGYAQEKLQPRVTEAYLNENFDREILREMGSLGLIGAIELTNDKAKRTRFASPGRVGTICRDHSFKSGLIMRACWDTMVLAPPLVITRQEIDELVQRVRVALDATYAEVKSEVI